MNLHNQPDNSLLLADDQTHFFNRIVEVIEPVKLGLTVLAASFVLFSASLVFALT